MMGRRAGVAALWATAVALALSACLSADLPTCANGLVCPVGWVCAEQAGICATPEQIEVCDGIEPPYSTLEEAACQYSGVGGFCLDGVCQPSQCGNGRVDLDELCDEGDTVGGDGCSADCRSTEECGNGLLDIGEECDCGNELLAARPDGCIGPNSNVEGICGGTCLFSCGDGLLQASELCDPEAPNGTPFFCADLALDYGLAGCTSFCTPWLDSCIDFGFNRHYTSSAPMRAIWVGDDAVVAAGHDGIIEHFGIGASGQLTGPSTVVVPGASIRGIDGRSSSDIYAVTEEGDILHFDGGQWSVARAEILARFSSVWVDPSSAAVFAAGALTDDSNNPIDELVVYTTDGASWNRDENIVDSEYVELKAVWGGAANDVYVAGKDVVAHYGGSDWDNVSPTPPFDESRLTDIVGVGSSMYVVGYDTNQVGIVVRRDDVGSFSEGTLWVTEINSGPPLSTISARGSSDILAFGAGGGFHYDGSAWMRLQAGSGSYISEVEAGAKAYYADYFSGDVRRTRGYFWSRHVGLGTSCLVAGEARNGLFAVCGGPDVPFHAPDGIWKDNLCGDKCNENTARDAFSFGDSGFVVTGDSDGDEGTTDRALLLGFIGGNWSIKGDFASVFLNAGVAVSSSDIWVAGRRLKNTDPPFADGPYLAYANGADDPLEHPLLGVVPLATEVKDIIASANDDVYAAVTLSSGGSQVIHYDGDSWSTFGPTLDCLALSILEWNGFVWAAGVSGCLYQLDAAQATRWESTTTESLGALAATPEGGLFASGSGGTLLHFDGTQFVPIAPIEVNITSMTAFGTELYLGTTDGEVWGLVGIDGVPLEEAATP